MENNNLVENIEKEIYKKGLSKNKVLTECGLSAGILNNWKNRNSNDISLSAVKKITDYLNITIDSLFENNNNQNKQNTFLQSDNKYQEIIIKNIKLLTKNNNLTTTKLATSCGLHKDFLFYWETKKENIEIIQLEKIANFFNIQIDDLIDRESPQKIKMPRSEKTIKEYVRTKLNTKENDAKTLETYFDLKPNTIEQWKQRNPYIEEYVKIANRLNISFDELIGREPLTQPIQTPLDPTTRELLDNWNKLSNTQKERILGQIQGLLGLNEPTEIEKAFNKGETIGRDKVKNNQKLQNKVV